DGAPLHDARPARRWRALRRYGVVHVLPSGTDRRARGPTSGSRNLSGTRVCCRRWPDELLAQHSRCLPAGWPAALGGGVSLRAPQAKGSPRHNLIGNHPVKAAASLFAALGSRAEVFFLGVARLGGVAAVCDATEGVFDRKRIKCIGIVVARPFFEMGMARMRTGSDRFEEFVEAWGGAAILGRAVFFAPDGAPAGGRGAARAQTG